MELKLKRCTIRDYRPSDAESLAKHANNRKVWLGLRDAFRIPTRLKTRTTFSKDGSPDCAVSIFASTWAVRRLVGSACGRAKMFIGTPRNLVIGLPKNSGGKAS